MRLARKLFLLAAMAIAALAMTASTASAQIVELSEEGGDHCPAVVKNVHDVTGGCHIEFESENEVPLVANVPGVGVVTLSNCEVHIEARVGEDGEGWVTQALLTGHPAPSVPCTRTPCDEAAPSHVELPWEIHIEEDGPGLEFADVRFCLRPVANDEGVGNSFCTVHLPISDNGNHDYEIGDNADAHCEPGDFPFDVWIETPHFQYEEGSTEPKIEIVH